MFRTGQDYSDRSVYAIMGQARTGVAKTGQNRLEQVLTGEFRKLSAVWDKSRL